MPLQIKQQHLAKKFLLVDKAEISTVFTFLLSDYSSNFLGSIGQSNLRQLNMADSYIIPIKGALTHFLRILPLSL